MFLYPKVLRKEFLLLLILLLLLSCGTGPWIINKRLYKVYKEDIYTSAKDYLRTDGYYLRIGALPNRVNYRDLIVFYPDGYSTSIWYSEDLTRDQIKFKITHFKDTLQKDLSWWRVKNDSLIIEHYGAPKRDMTTFVYYNKGRILNDTLIELNHDNKPPFGPVRYKFVKSDTLPVIINIAGYLKKDWYIDQLNASRKNSSNNLP